MLCAGMQPIQPMSPSTDDHHLSQPGFEATISRQIAHFRKGLLLTPLPRGRLSPLGWSAREKRDIRIDVFGGEEKV